MISVGNWMREMSVGVSGTNPRGNAFNGNNDKYLELGILYLPKRTKIWGFFLVFGVSVGDRTQQSGLGVCG